MQKDYIEIKNENAGQLKYLIPNNKQIMLLLSKMRRKIVRWKVFCTGSVSGFMLEALTRQMHSDVEKRRSSFLVALLFAASDLRRNPKKIRQALKPR